MPVDYALDAAGAVDFLMQRSTMQRLMLATVLCVAMSVRIPASTSLDTPVDSFTIPNPPPRCGVNAVLMKLAIDARILLGFESVPECVQHSVRKQSTSRRDQRLENVTGRELLDFLLTLAPEYRWQDVGGVAVVRPAAAWTDTTDVLNFRATAFQLTDGRLSDGLKALLNMPRPDISSSRPDSLIERQFSMTFAHGTVLDALNAMIRAHENAMWEAGVELQRNRPFLMVHFWAHDLSGFGEGTFVAPSKSAATCALNRSNTGRCGR